MRRARVSLWVGGAVWVLLAAACGGDGDDVGEQPADTAATTVTTQPTATTADDGAAEASPVAADTSAVPDVDDEAAAGGGGDLSLVPDGETDLLGNPAGQGYVEVDGVRYDFILNGACQKLFGAVQADGAAADGSDVRVSAIIPPEDWETDAAADWDPPSVSVDFGDVSWKAQIGSEHLAGGETTSLTPEQSSVTSFTNDGALTSGEANFYNEYNFDDVETTSGTFEFFCP